MAFSFSGHAAAGGAEAFQEALARALQEEVVKQEMAMREQRMGLDRDRLGLDRERLAQDATQHGDRVRLDQARLDEMATGRREEANRAGVEDMNAQAATMGKAADKAELMQFITGMQTPEHTRTEANLRARGVNMDVGDPNELGTYEAKKKIDFKYRDRPESGGGAGAGKDAPMQSMLQGFLTDVNKLSKRINTKDGLAARAVGTGRNVLGWLGTDTDIKDYNDLISGFTPALARAVGHVGVLTEQDVQSVKRTLPATTDTRELAQRKMERIGRLLNKRFAGDSTPEPELDAAGLPVQVDGGGGGLRRGKVGRGPNGKLIYQ